MWGGSGGDEQGLVCSGGAGRKLAHTEKDIRDKAFAELSAWLQVRAPPRPSGIHHSSDFGRLEKYSRKKSEILALGTAACLFCNRVVPHDAVDCERRL